MQIKKIYRLPVWQQYGLTLLGLSLVGTGFLAVGATKTGVFDDWYLLWNLFLAWIPLLLAFALVRCLKKSLWSSWPAIGLSLAWLLFLPNSFYMVSDFIHLEDTPRTDVLFDSLMFSIVIITGLLVGFTSLYLVQKELQRRLSAVQTTGIITIILALCSFAIYLGRELRWNSWDVLINPAGILFDVSERLIDPLAHPRAFSVTLMFLIFLGTLYATMWLLLRIVRRIP